MTAREAADKINGYPVPSVPEVERFILASSARELQNFIHWLDVTTLAGRTWFDRAKVTLDVRLAEDAAATAEKMAALTRQLVEQTEKLMAQTAEHVRHSEKLTQQTETLITESRNLTKLTETLTQQNGTIINESKQVRRLTFGLFWLTVALTFVAALQLFHDWHK